MTIDDPKTVKERENYLASWEAHLADREGRIAKVRSDSLDNTRDKRVDVERLLNELLRDGFTVVLHGFRDEGVFFVSGTAGNDRDTRSTTCTNLTELLQSLTGTMGKKTCKGPCGERKPLSSFLVNRTHADGRQSQCKECMEKKKRKVS